MRSSKSFKPAFGAKLGLDFHAPFGGDGGRSDTSDGRPDATMGWDAKSGQPVKADFGWTDSGSGIGFGKNGHERDHYHRGASDFGHKGDADVGGSNFYEGIAKGLSMSILRNKGGEVREFLENVREVVAELREDGQSRPLGQVIKALIQPERDLPDDKSAFQYGVASGDPDAESVVLWTHARPFDLEDGENVIVSWEVATDAAFRHVVDRGIGVADEETDYTFKAIADGLEAGEDYYYRFRVDGEYSEVGSTRTLPEGYLESVEFAVFSCVNYPAGFFNAYKDAALNGFDFSVHLGDYIYEYGIGEYATERAEALGRVPSPENEIITAEDYSQRYAQYTSDADLQAVRATAPMIMMWDDHETANDSWETGAENHDPATEGDWFERRDVALEAYFNWNPLREPESRDLRDHDKTYEFGDLVDLHMLETRLQARDETRADILTALTGRIAEYQSPTSTLLFEDAALAGVPDTVVLQTLGSGDAAAIQALFTGLALTGLVAEAQDPDRDMIGEAQLDELVGKIEASDAIWQVIGSQTLMGRMELPAEVLGGFEQLAELFFRSAIGATTPEEEFFLYSFDEQNEVPYNFDSWDGYQAERETILEALAASESGGIVLAGDTHNAWTSNVRTADGTLAAVEFGGPGVTSPGFEGLFPELLNPFTGEPVDYVAEAFLRYVDDLLYANLSDRGYMAVEFTRDEVVTDYVFVETDRQDDYLIDVETQTVTVDQFEFV